MNIPGSLSVFFEGFASSPGARLLAGVLVLGAFGYLYFRNFKGVGSGLFLLAAMALIGLFSLHPAVQLIASVILLLAFPFVGVLRRERKDLGKDYQHAEMRFEGGGVKRGLGAAEAAVLLGEPFNLTLALIVFGMLRKGVLRQESDSPLVVAVKESFRARDAIGAEERAAARRRAAQEINAVLQPYEEGLIELLLRNPDVPLREIDLSLMVKPLLKRVAERLAGWDLEESRQYYRLIIKRAPVEARSDGHLVHERQQVFDRNFEWVLLNDDFGSILDSEILSYTPVWLRTPDGEARPLEGGASFAQWAGQVIEEMREAISPEALRLKLGSEVHPTTATLLHDIAQATFYG